MKSWTVNGPWPDNDPDNVYIWVTDESYILGYDFIYGHEKDEMIWLQPERGLRHEVLYLPRSWTVA